MIPLIQAGKSPTEIYETLAFEGSGFFPRPADPAIVESYTTYGERFASSVWRGNVFATQFHPEKSQKVGLRLMHNFVAMSLR